MVSRLQPTLSFALRPVRPLGLGTYESGPAIRHVLFYLQRVAAGEQNRCFYECSEPGCHGCGCPSFEVTEERIIPDWVFDCLRIHLELAHQHREGGY